MKLREYLDTSKRGTATNLARALDVSLSYLSQMADGKAPISTERAVLIERETFGIVSRKDMFPESWANKWPELDTRRHASDRRINRRKGASA